MRVEVGRWTQNRDMTKELRVGGAEAIARERVLDVVIGQQRGFRLRFVEPAD